MTVTNQDCRWAYVGDGTTASFAFDNVVYDAEDLQVYLAGVFQATGYSVTGLGIQTGGAVVFTTPPPALTSVLILSAIPETQSLHYSEGDPFPSVATEIELDRLTRLAQQLDARLQRTLRMGDTEAMTSVIAMTVAAFAGKVVGIDSNGNPIPVASGAPSGDASLLTVTAFGANRARTLANLTGDRPCVLDWNGVDPTGSADSTAGLNAAAAQMILEGGGELWAPPGKYVVGTSQPLVIGTVGQTGGGVQFVGVPPSRVSGTLGMSAGGSQFLNASPSNDLLLLNAPGSGTRGIGFGSAPGVTPSGGGAAVHVVGKGCTVRDFLVDGGWNGVLVDGADGWDIDGVIVNVIGAYGFRAQKSATSQAILGKIRLQVIPSEVLHTPGTTDGIQIGDGCNSCDWGRSVVNYAARGWVIGDGTSDTPNNHRLYMPTAESCTGDGFVINGARQLWLTALYSSVNGGHGVTAADGLDAIGSAMWIVAPRWSGNGKHGFNGRSFRGIHIIAPRGGNNSNSGQGPMTPNVYDEINISAVASGAAWGSIIGGQLGGDIHEDPTHHSDARYGIAIEATVTDPRLYIVGNNVQGHQTGGILDLSAGSSAKIIKDNPGDSSGVDFGAVLAMNGSLAIWQRGTSFAFGSLIPVCDGFVARRGNNDPNGTLTRQSGGPHAMRYYARLQRTAGDTSIQRLLFSHTLETADSIPLAGGTLRVRFSARPGANMSGAGLGMACFIVTGRGVDESASNMSSGGWTSGVPTQHGVTLVAGTWVDFVVANVLDSLATQVGIYLQYTPTGTAGAADYVDLAAISISLATRGGDVIEFLPESQELVRCQRRGRGSFDYGQTPGQNVGTVGAPAVILPTGASGAFSLAVAHAPMRISVAPTLYNPSAANANWRDSTNSADRTAAVINAGRNGFTLTGAGGVQGSTNSIQWWREAEFT